MMFNISEKETGKEIPEVKLTTVNVRKNNLVAESAMKKLMEGNQRFISGDCRNPRRSMRRVTEISNGQNPFAAVIGCSDSRIVPEIIFDQGLGDLFVVRVAGNTVGNVCIGSVEFAVEHLGVQLVLVLGHKRCGVVKTAASGDDVHHHLGSLVATAQAAIKKAEGMEGCLIDNAAKENVRLLIEKLKRDSPVIATLVNEGKLVLKGAFYDVDTGVVEILN